MSRPVTNKRIEAAKKELIEIENAKTEEVALEQPSTVEPPPFGGGHLIGLMVNPSSIELQQLQGFDEYGLSMSRSYGGSLYLPLVEHCKALIESDSPAMKAAGTLHINDRFMIRRKNSQLWTEAEQAMYDATQAVGQQLLDKGAIGPLVFPRVEIMGHFGPEILPSHYIPSCGIYEEQGMDNDDGIILRNFIAFMAKPDRWTLEIL
jgi:hypothetical protein